MMGWFNWIFQGSTDMWKGLNTDATLAIGDRKIAINVGQDITWALPESGNLTVDPTDTNDIWVWKVNEFGQGGELTIQPPTGGQLHFNGTPLGIDMGQVIANGEIAILVPIGPNTYAMSVL